MYRSNLTSIHRYYGNGIATYFYVALFVLVLFQLPAELKGQCAFGGTAYGNNITPTNVGQTVTLNNWIWGGEQYTLNATAGCTYTISMCGTSWDTQITVFDPGQTVVGYNDDSCGLQSQVTFTASSTGPYIVQVNTWPCGTNFSGAEYFGVTLVACTPPEGCTDPTACNYDPSAQINDGSCCYTGCLTITAGGGTWDGEISWDLFDGATFVASGIANLPDGLTICGATDACYTVNLYDSFGDGWNGATMTIVYNGNTVVSTTMTGGSFLSVDFAIGNVVTGCTQESAPNYNPLATCDDGSCQDCFDPEASGCPDIDLGADITMPSCFDPCATLELQADVFQTGNTTAYDVCEIGFNPPYPFTAGTGFSIGVDDLWTGAISLPFNFCFFGNTYNQCVVGANGLLSFDMSYASAYCPWAFNATCPSPALPLNAVFGPYHDIDPSVCGDARYAIQGNYPCRVFIVNYDNVCHFSCNSLISTHQIVLYETTNVIEVYIENKPTCTGWNSGNALVGIQNATGTIGYTPNSRQTGPWTASSEGWRFTPSGPDNYVVNWYDEGGNYLNSGLTTDVCPGEDPQTFEAEAVYTACDGSQITVTDDVIVTCLSILLSVEWLEFDAELSTDETKVHCSWVTGSETDNDYFTVERSADGEVWSDIGEVDGSGTTTEPHSYSYVDHDPLPGISYYRLRQTNFNGESGHSEIRVVERTESIEWVLFPNPGNGKFRVQTPVRNFELKAIDARGREVAVLSHPSGEYTIRNAEPGYYTIEISSVGGELMKRLPLLVE